MRKAVRITGIAIVSLLLLVILTVLLLLTPPGARLVRIQAEKFLEKKIGKDVQIGGLSYALPRNVVLEEVFIPDVYNDTLLYAGALDVNLDMLALIGNKVKVKNLSLSDAFINLQRRRQDTVFNFQYIVDAFVGEQQKATTPDTLISDTTAALQFDVNRLELENIRFKMNDVAGGIFLHTSMAQLDALFDKVNIEEETYTLKELFVDGWRTNFFQNVAYLQEEKDTTSSPLNMVVGVSELNLNNTSFLYRDLESDMMVDVGLKHAVVTSEPIHLGKQLISIHKLHIDTAHTNVIMEEYDHDWAATLDSVFAFEDTTEAQGWRIAANEAVLNNVHFIYDNQRLQKQPSGIDYNHLNVQNINLQAARVLYTADTILGQIKNLALNEKSGFNLERLRTDFLYHNQGGVLRDLYLKTDNSLLQQFVQVRYPSIDALTQRLETLYLLTDIRNSVVGVKDILLFAPQLLSNDFFRRQPHAQLQTTIQAKGFLNALDIQRLYLAGIGNTTIDVSGKLNGLPTMERLQYQLNIAHLQTSAKDLSAFIPATYLKDVRLPDQMKARGRLSGTLTNFNPDLYIQTSDGNLQAQGFVDISERKERYDLKIITDNLFVGRIIKQEQNIGRISAHLKVSGRGFDPKTMNAVVSGRVNKAEYNGYAYNNVQLNAQASNGIIHADVESDDPNAELDLNLSINMQGAQTVIAGKMMLDSIDLQRLGFSDKEFRIRGKIIADFEDVNPDYPVGSLTMDHPIVVYDGQRYVLDSLYLVSAPSNGNQDIKLYADVVGAELTGRLPLTRSADVITQRINRYYRLTTQENLTATADQKPLPEDYDLTFHAEIYDRPLLYSFLPSLTYFDSASVYASFTPYLMSVEAFMPTMIMGENEIQNLQVSATGADSAMRYSANVAHLQLPFVEVWDGKIGGEVKNDVVHTVVSLADRLKKERFALGGLLYRDEGMQTISLSDSLVMDYTKWEVAQPNRIVLGNEGMFVDNFRIRRNEQSLSLASTPPQFNAPLEATVNQFQLLNITSLLNQDTLLANGALNGTLSVKQFSPVMKLNADMRIHNLSIYGDTVGLFQLVGAMDDGNTFDLDASITEQQNDVRITGNYFLNPVNGNNLDLDLRLNALNLRSVQGASLGALKNSEGFIRGEARIQGPTATPKINGVLVTDNLSTTVALLGGRFTMPSEQISFQNNTISLNRFKVYDSLGQPLTINGVMETKTWQDFDFDMSIAAKNWMLMNSTSEVNKDYYGKVYISPNFTLRGSTSALDIDGNLTIHDSTRLNVTLPETRKQIESSEGIVLFTDFSDSNAHLLIPRANDTVRTVKLGLGSRVNVNVNVEKRATFNVFMEEGTGDFLQVRGMAALNTVVNPDGTLGFTGNYELEDGAYEFNYNFVKRKFLIEKGSTLTFLGGDPTQANLNVRAIYEADIAPYDLVENQVDQNDLVYYQQRLPFEVILKLNGALLKPELSFDIELPEEKSVRAGRGVAETVEGKLNVLRNNPSEMNKQVFAVLLLNRFVAENPFTTSNALQIEHAVRQSVSRFLTEQLNKFADQIIDGFDFNLDLNSSEDYTTGEKRNRTDLSLAASKQLLNDRLTITIGNDFTLEGPAGNRQQSFIPGNLALDYTLTQDGRYAVRAYRTNRDMGVIEGFVVETGVKFRVNVDYNRFRYLFESTKKREAREQEELEKAYQNQTRISGQ